MNDSQDSRSAAGEQPSVDSIPLPVIDYRPPADALARRRAWPDATRILGIALAVVVAAALVFLFGAGTVQVRTVPEARPDRIDFSGTPDIAIGDRHLVWPGARRLTVEAAGFSRAAVPVTVSGAAGQVVVVPLERLPGTLRFDTGGIAATLTVDGKRLGAVPGDHELRAGAREILVEAPHHATWRARLMVKGGGELELATIKLEPAYAGVTVQSVPSGAHVVADGQPLGATPLTVSLDAGRHELRIEHPGFRPWVAPVTVRAGEPLVIGPIQLGLPDGRLSVRTQPAGAAVAVAGLYRGKTPVTLQLPAGVSSELVVDLAGYAPVKRAVSVAPGTTSALDLKLAAIFGDVTVRGTPADAELLVDGVPRGSANQTLRLPAAPAMIEVRKPGLEPFRASVMPRPGLPQVVEFTLHTAEQQRLARFAATIRTALGQELRLLPAGRYVTGSPRREPGRRSNEAERPVELRRLVYLATTEVTNLEFRAFRPQHMTGAFKQETLDLDQQPIGSVSWQDAAEFCNWLSARDGLPATYVQQGARLALAQPSTTGYRLPTESEWEYAARYAGPAATRKYPWGDALPVAPGSGNYADQAAQFLAPVVLEGYSDGARVSAPVGSYPASNLGFRDLGGNVAEWVNDFYSVYVVMPGQQFVDPLGPAEGQQHVVRGASWLTGRVPELRLAWRDAGTGPRPDLGFRIARYAE